MTYALDADLTRAVAAMIASGATLPPPAPRDDWKALRAAGEASLAAMEAALPENASVTRQERSATSRDGTPVPLRWYTPQNHDRAGAGPAAVYLHGGGMILGSVPLHDRLVAAL